MVRFGLRTLIKACVSILEKVYRRTSILVPARKTSSYDSRLKTILSIRQNRGDLIQLQKLMHGIDII